jgi:hypothetical protein
MYQTGVCSTDWRRQARRKTGSAVGEVTPEIVSYGFRPAAGPPVKAV